MEQILDRGGGGDHDIGRIARQHTGFDAA